MPTIRGDRPRKARSGIHRRTMLKGTAGLAGWMALGARPLIAQETPVEGGVLRVV
jgi:hypothetical protein